MNDRNVEEDEERYRIFLSGIYWVFAENLTACIDDSPDIKSRIKILIIIQIN